MTNTRVLTRTESAGFLSACAAAFCVSTAATIYFCRSMAGGMEMPGGWTMSMMWMRMPSQTWFMSGAMFLLMWLAMMVAMMLPSAMPMLNSYRRWRAGEEAACISTLIVASGYFAVWQLIGLVMYVACVSWAYATMRWSGLSRLVPSLIGVLLLLSGMMQFSRWKMSALKRCRDPLSCAALQAVDRRNNAWWHGLRQGASCAICCSGPMLALLALGAMNPAVMIIIAVVIAMEKLAPKPELIVRISGALAILAGCAMVLQRVLR
jgi:predicted metal-binding membrane protein